MASEPIAHPSLTLLVDRPAVSCENSQALVFVPVKQMKVSYWTLSKQPPEWRNHREIVIRFVLRSKLQTTIDNITACSCWCCCCVISGHKRKLVTLPRPSWPPLAARNPQLNHPRGLISSWLCFIILSDRE